jgi:hypothetical protein
MFTQGRIIFVVAFVVVFAAALAWSYRKERKLNQVHFKHTYKIFLALILFLIVQYLIVKMRKFL